MENKKKKIYIVLTQTGTLLSRIVKVATKKEYNHASIALDGRLDEMYSFARRYPHNPVWGGFVTESPRYGTFKVFKQTTAKIIELEIDADTYDKIAWHLHEMYRNRRCYHYNYGGLLAGAFHKKATKKNHYYCSEFVKDLLVEYGVADESSFGNVIYPVDFLKIKEGKIVYIGKLSDFTTETSVAESGQYQSVPVFGVQG